MALGTVLMLGDHFAAFATAHMGSDALASMEDLHRRSRGADLHDWLHQRVG